MRDRLAGLMREVSTAVLETPGELDRDLRRRIAAGEPAPAELATYVEKVRRHAYRVTDADVDALRASGLSDDGIFELTLAAALGAARTRLERGLETL